MSENVRYSVDDTIYNDPVRRRIIRIEIIDDFNCLDNIKFLKEQNLDESEKFIFLRKYTVNGHETFLVFINGLEVGVLPQDSYDLLTSGKYEYELSESELNSFETDGKITYYAKIFVKYKIKRYSYPLVCPICGKKYIGTKNECEHCYVNKKFDFSSPEKTLYELILANKELNDVKAENRNLKSQIRNSSWEIERAKMLFTNFDNYYDVSTIRFNDGSDSPIIINNQPNTTIDDNVLRKAFKIKGVTQFNRQENIKALLNQKLSKEDKRITLERFSDDGTSTLCVFLNGLEIGILPPDSTKWFLSSDYNYELTNIHLGNMLTDDGKNIYYAKLYATFTLKKPTSTSNSRTKDFELASIKFELEQHREFTKQAKQEIKQLKQTRTKPRTIAIISIIIAILSIFISFNIVQNAEKEKNNALEKNSKTVSCFQLGQIIETAKEYEIES